MAKAKSLLELTGTIGGLTYVNSLAYGPHVRAARGTYKKAKVNRAFKKQSRQLMPANKPAKVLNDALIVYRKGLERGSLWRRLVSMFNTQLEEAASVDFSKLKPFEIHERYPFDRFLHLQPEIKFNKKKRVITVRLSYPAPPRFQKFINGYRLGVIGIFPRGLETTATTAANFTQIISLKENVHPLTFQFPVHARAKSCLICLKIEGCINDAVYMTPTTKGMKVVWSGAL